MRGRQHYNELFQLYHLSENDQDGKTFIPIPLTKERAMEGENWKTPRICVSTSIDGALSSLCDSISLFTGLQYYVHVPVNLVDLFKRNKVYRPSLKQVPDSEATGEYWLRDNATWHTIGKLEVTGLDDSKDITFIWDGEETPISRFTWKWLEQKR